MPARVSTTVNLVALNLLLLEAGCALSPSDTRSGSRPPTAQAPVISYDQALVAQVDSPEMRDYLRYLCGLPAEERWKKATELLKSNRVLAQCAFDAAHPAPDLLPAGQIASIPASS